MRKSFPVDLAAYGRAFVLLVRNPQIMLAPLVANVAAILLLMLFPADAGGDFLSSANAGLAGLAKQLIESFGLAVALIVASTAWRRGRAPFDDAWEDARRKMGDIVFAALGLGFVIYIAGIVGRFLGPFEIALAFVAYFFFVYTMPAAAIGGVPGSAALNVSVERARRAPLPTLIVTVVYVVSEFRFVPRLILQALDPLIEGNSFFGSAIASSLLVAAINAVVTGYVALVLAKTYEDVSYGRSF